MIIWLATAFSHRGCEIELISVNPSYKINPFYEINSRLKRPPAAGIEPRSPRTKFLRSERSTTELAGPGFFNLYLSATKLTLLFRELTTGKIVIELKVIGIFCSLIRFIYGVYYKVFLKVVNDWSS